MLMMRVFRNICFFASCIMTNYMVLTKGCFTCLVFVGSPNTTTVEAETTAYVKHNT